MRSIIFDLDDTLYVSKKLRNRRERAILGLLKGRTEEYHKLREKYNTIATLEKMSIGKYKFFELMESVPIQLKKDMLLRKILSELKSDFKLIVLSNSPILCVTDTLRELGILDLIDEYYGGDSFNKTKPAEEFFCIVKKGDICVGNNFKKDLLVPKQKGAVTVLIGTEGDAHYKISSIHELGSVISNRYLNK